MTAIKRKISGTVPSKNATDATSEMVRRRPWRFYADVGDGFDITGAIGVGIGAGVASMLRLPLSAVVLATLLVSNSGLGAGPLIVVGVVAYMTTMALSKSFDAAPDEQPQTTAATASGSSAKRAPTSAVRAT